MTPPDCPLCLSRRTRDLMVVDDRRYYRCQRCQCRFLDPAQHPSPDAEKAEYDLHHNAIEDPGYRNFLKVMAEPLLQRVRPNSKGLDYGCGPGPALAALLEQAGHAMVLFDPIYYNEPSALAQRYDFITCTEVAEHFHRPAVEFERLDGLLRSGGWLGLMTRFQTDDDRFANWHYRRDPTHVIFYRRETIEWLAQSRGWIVDLRPPTVALFQKPF